MEEKALGKRLQAARKRAGLTQQELCQAVGLSYSTLAKIERGAIRSPSIFTVAAVAGATGVTLDDLLAGFVKNSAAPLNLKKVSKTGVRFVYFDVNGVLIRSALHKMFTVVSAASGQPIDAIEMAFWRYNDRLDSGKLPISELNRLLSQQYGQSFDLEKLYFKSAEVNKPGYGLLAWASEHYDVGLLSNHAPGFIDKLQQKNLLPKVDIVVDSSVVGAVKPSEKIYKIAQKRSGMEPAEILFVDNERPNLITADRLGWQTAWFDDFHPSESVKRIKKILEF